MLLKIIIKKDVKNIKLVKRLYLIYDKTKEHSNKSKLDDERERLNVVNVIWSFILKSAQQEEALRHIWYALKRWRLVSRQIVLFPTTTCSSINRR
ncbi:unnamed protein product [Spirodela intermedia]|uniref:Uncharacterized protein n=1 Tax=Spirodela intermedia TaxID=51605 RepID=A0A7I8KDE2_SPIIN|nr:unnamed protein product [Spirodela intermedia]